MGGVDEENKQRRRAEMMRGEQKWRPNETRVA